jgi:hypothetical protein
MRITMKHLIWILTVLLASCSLFQVREDPRAANYKLGTLSRDWMQSADAQKAGTDFVFEHKKNKAILSVNSVCGRYPTATLQSLASQLAAPINSAEVIEERELTLDGRDAFLRRVHGKLDGVAVQTMVVVLRKNNCLFDFALLKSAPLDANDIETFQKFLSEFRYE